MSGLVPLVWAFKVAPVKDGIEKLVLQCLADAADEDGCNAYLAQATVAERAMIDGRTVRRRLAELEERGIISRGDQRAVSHLPADKRPVVWDVMIPYAAFGDGIDSVNSFRKGKGRPPITPQNRPSLAPSPDAKVRKDKGQKKASERGGSETGGTSSPAGQKVRPDTDAPAGGLEDRARADLKSDNLPPTTFPLDLPPTEPADKSTGTDQPALIAVEPITGDASSTRATGSKRSKGEPSPHQEAARRISRLWWEWWTKKYGEITGSYVGFEKNTVLSALERGWTEDEVQQALMRPPNASTDIPDALPSKLNWQRALTAVRTGAPAIGQRAGQNAHHVPVNDPDRQARANAF